MSKQPANNNGEHLGPFDPKMFETFYEELRKIAGYYMRGERAGHTLQPTALVNEAFLRFAKARHLSINDRVHFLRLAARTMRRILIELGRRPGGTRITLSDDIEGESQNFALVDLGRALDKLSKLNDRQATILEMRYIAGLTVHEVATELKVSPSTVKGDTRFALAWLKRELG